MDNVALESKHAILLTAAVNQNLVVLLVSLLSHVHSTIFFVYPRPTNGCGVGMTVISSTLADSGMLAMATTHSAT